MSNAEVGKIVARVQKKETIAEPTNDDADNKKEGEIANNETSSTDDYVIVTPNQAAARLMTQCLKNGGHMDDVTILIVDVTYTGNVTYTANESGHDTYNT
jgi:hypothetical protein